MSIRAPHCAYAPDPCRNLGDLVAAYWDEFVVAHLQHDHPVPAGRAREGAAMRPAAGNPDRDPRPLHRAGQEYRPVDAVVRSGMLYRFPESKPSTISKPSSSRSARIRGSVGSPNVPYSASMGVPRADAEDRSTAREPVQRGHLSRELPRPAPWHRRDRCPDLDPGRGVGDRTQRNPRVDDGKPHLTGTENVIPQQEAVPSLTFCRHRKLHEYIRLGERRHVDRVTQRHPHSVPGRNAAVGPRRRATRPRLFATSLGQWLPSWQGYGLEALKTPRERASFEPAKNERSYAFRDPFDSPAFDTLRIARLTGSSTAGDDDAEDRKNERKGAEYEILPPAL